MSHSPKETAVTPWISEERVKELKQTVSVASVLEHYGLLEGLQRKGSSRLIGRSPFREDRHPSFAADLNKNLWNDFGGRPVVDGQEVAGDVFGLVQAIKGCSFREALLELSEKVMGRAGEIETRTEAQAKETRARVVQTVKAKKPEKTKNIPFGKELKGRTNIPPLLERGIKEETIRKFGVVYATSGLMMGRIAFPIRNVAGEVVAYAGRAVKKSDESNGGKYRFPPGFRKQFELYNIDRIAGDSEVKKAVKDYGIIIVEGFTDVMVLDQEGFPNVVALMGSVMSEQQKAMLLDPKLNSTRRLTLFLDNDEAGQNGKRRIAQELIHEAFVRYTDWRGLPEYKNEPEHFKHDELVELLGFKNKKLPGEARKDMMTSYSISYSHRKTLLAIGGLGEADIAAIERLHEGNGTATDMELCALLYESVGEGVNAAELRHMVAEDAAVK